MSTPDFSTAENNQELATEVNLKTRLLASLSAGFASGAKHRQHVISDLSPQRSRQSVFYLAH